MTAPQSTGRIDTLTSDMPSRQRMRRTDYSGIVWLGGDNPGEGGMLMMSNAAPATESFWVPDSLPYASATASQVQLAVNVALVGGGETASVTGARVDLVADPRGNQVHWLQVTLDYRGRVPLGVSYTVVAMCEERGIAGETGTIRL